MADRRIAEKTGIAADPSDTDSRSVPWMRLSVSVKSAPVKRSSKWCAEEENVEIVQALSFGPAHLLGRPIGFRELTLLVHCHAGEAVVGWVTEDCSNPRFLVQGD